LARCDRVCKRWQKSSTLNYGEHCMGGTHSCLSGMLTPLPSFSPFPLHSTPLISSISFTKTHVHASETGHSQLERHTSVSKSLPVNSMVPSEPCPHAAIPVQHAAGQEPQSRRWTRVL
jgi:hypothetical protein